MSTSYLTTDMERELVLSLDASVKEADALLQDNEQGKGGRFRLFLLKSPFRGHVDLECVFESPWVGGDTNRGNEAKYNVYTWEKAIRLAQMYALHRHASSAQSADPSLELWDGASLVRVIMKKVGPLTLIPSVSGWPEKADAAIGLRTVQRAPIWRCGRSSFETAVAAGKNGFAEKLLSLPLAT